MVPAPFNVRRCAPRDEDAVYEVCLRTGDNGHDATHLFDDPRALGYIFVGPYMKLEPETALVLEDPQGVCGYALGALDSKKFYDAYRIRWLPEIQKRHPEPAGDRSKWTRTQGVYYEYYHPDIFLPVAYDQYPSHLHIDLLPRAQGRGYGRRMLKQLMDKMHRRGSPGAHLCLSAVNTSAFGFYQRLGFQELLRVDSGNDPCIYMGKDLTGD